MSGQDGDQIVIQYENPKLVEKPQSATVDPFDHIVVGLWDRKMQYGQRCQSSNQSLATFWFKNKP